MSSELTVDDSTLKKRNQMKKLQLDSDAYVLNLMQICPESACCTKLCTQGMVQHILDAHKAVPKFVIQFEQYRQVEVNLRTLDHGKSYYILVLLITINSDEYDVVNDTTAMPLMVMAAKINPCGPPVFTEFGDGPIIPRGMQLMCPGEVVMIWICGHLPTISSLIRVKTRHNVTNEYAGNIHSVAENNFNPNVVFARGNCLLIPAHNAMELTQNGKIPLKVEVQLSVQK